MVDYKIPTLPLSIDIESKAVLKKAARAHQALGQLNGMAQQIPNESILINTLPIQEAKDSSEIENIITTHDEIYKELLFSKLIKSPAAKEVGRYTKALGSGFRRVSKDRLLTNNIIINLHTELSGYSEGFRRQGGTKIINDATGETVFTPPQDPNEVLAHMDNLEKYINTDKDDLDPLVKMAIIHHQFESVHPFTDGNGRTGRIINILFLVKEGLLDIPVLYLSRYIIQHKDQYYGLLQKVRTENAWEEWILYMLEGIECTAWQTISIIKEMKSLMQRYKHGIREDFPKYYSQDLINNIFKHPYTKIAFLMDDLRVTRLTARKYLEQLSEAGYLEKFKISGQNYYINTPLHALLSDIPELESND